MRYFNPRTHEGCDPIIRFTIAARSLNFNPRTHEGCDAGDHEQEQDAFGISIHAPMKGATPYFKSTYQAGDQISIHAPMKGATFDAIDHAFYAFDFNPRTHEGCDSKSRKNTASPA